LTSWMVSPAEQLRMRSDCTASIVDWRAVGFPHGYEVKE